MKLELPTLTKRTPSKKIPTLRARYALALIEEGHEATVSTDDQKRLLAARLVTMGLDGALVPTVAGCKVLHGTED